MQPPPLRGVRGAGVPERKRGGGGGLPTSHSHFNEMSERKGSCRLGKALKGTPIINCLSMRPHLESPLFGEPS